MREIKLFVLAVCLFVISSAQAHDVIDMSDIFLKRRASVQKNKDCETNLDKTADVVQIKDRVKKPSTLVPITQTPTIVDISETGVTVSEAPAIKLVGATPNIQSVFERLTDLRLRGKQFETKDEENSYANLMYVAAQEVYQNNEDDGRRNHLLTANFHTMNKNLPPGVRYKFLTNFLAGIEMSHAFNMDDKFSDLLVEWRLSHFELGFSDPMDDKVLDRYGLVRY